MRLTHKNCFLVKKTCIYKVKKFEENWIISFGFLTRFILSASWMPYIQLRGTVRDRLIPQIPKFRSFSRFEPQFPIRKKNINPFVPNTPFLYPWKHQMFSDVFRRSRKGASGTNGLKGFFANFTIFFQNLQKS